MESETQQTSSLYEFLGWFEANKKRVAIGAGALLVIVGLVVTVSWYKNQQEFLASEALSAIRIPNHPSETLAPGTAEKLQKMAQEYSGTAAAVRAELIRAGLLYTEGKYPEAAAAFDRWIREHGESQWLPQATFSFAVCLDAQNKPMEAVAKYKDFAARYPNDPNTDQARLHLASLYEATGQPALALEQYEKITKSVSYSPAMSEAQERQRLLLTKNPALASTNKVMAPKITVGPTTTAPVAPTPVAPAPVAPAPVAPAPSSK